LKKLLPGGNALELHVETGSGLDGLEDRLRALPGVAKVDILAPSDEARDSTAYRIYAVEAGTLVGPVVQSATGAGLVVRDISVKNATLEEVFIYLTGRHLR
jgi:ABC-2 type transport system ATP-binding protein